MPVDLEKKKEKYKIWKKNNPDYYRNYAKIWKKNNPEKVKTNEDKYCANHKEELIRKNKEWRENNKEKIKETNKKYYLKNKENINKKKGIYNKSKKENDPIFRLKCSIRSLISNSINRNGYKKISKTEEIIGCSFGEFKSHLEFKFEYWMTWDNYGKYNGELNYGWDIDHIIPTSGAMSEEDLIKLNHYSNLQPLCSKINRDIKTNKLNYVYN